MSTKKRTNTSVILLISLALILALQSCSSVGGKLHDTTPEITTDSDVIQADTTTMTTETNEETYPPMPESGVFVSSELRWVEPLSGFLYSTVYDEKEDAWLCGDGMGVYDELDKIKRNEEVDVPELVLGGDFMIKYPDGDTLGSMVIYDDYVEQLFYTKDVNELYDLPSGKYYITFSVSSKGGYSADGMSENHADEYLFALLVK